MSSDALSPRAFKASIEAIDPPRVLGRQQTIYFGVKIKNCSSSAWLPNDKYPVNFSYHWLTNGEVVVHDGARTALRLPLNPGEELILDCFIRSPDRVGKFELELDIVQEGVAWFKDKGSPTLRIPCEIVNDASTFRLRFTGNCDENQFRAACAPQDWWYHSYYFDNGFGVSGDYDIGRDIESYGFPNDMRGMTVLDIGTGGGWFAVYFAQKGAHVTAIDVRGTCDYDIRGGRREREPYPLVESEKAHPDLMDVDGKPLYFSRVSRSLWIMKDLLGLPIRVSNSRIYDLRPSTFEGKLFDLVFVGALLLHLRDPIGGLIAARSVCRDRLIATSPVISDDSRDEPWMKMAPFNAGAWWLPNKAAYRRWFLDAGFSQVDVERAVTLSGEAPHPSFDDPTPGAIRNGTQRLRLADARF